MRLCVEYQAVGSLRPLGLWHDAPAVPRIGERWQCGKDGPVYVVRDVVWMRREDEAWAIVLVADT